MMDGDGWRALHYFARFDDYESLQCIVERGIDINLKTSSGKNCLHIAAFYGHLNLCKTFVDKHNFDVHLVDNDGWTVLHHSGSNGSCELVTYFADMGTDIYRKNNLGDNCLHIAAKNSHLDLCKTLIDKYKFDVHTTNKEGQTALHHSARNSSFELVRYFIDMGSDIKFKDNSGMNALHVAAKNGHLDLCKKLIDKHKIRIDLPDYDGWIALHHSARNGSYDLVRYFADMVADLNLEDNSGMNCLHIAARNGHFSLCKTLIDKYKFNIHRTDNKGRTTLHHFAINGSYDFVRYFVDMGADVKLKDNLGMNCLHIAAKNGNFSLCKTLIDEYKFNVDMADNEGRTALHHSAINGSYDFFRYFVDMGADINLKDNLGLNFVLMAAQEGHVNLCKSLIEKHNVNFRVADSKGWTAIHYSAKSGSYELVKYFVDRGANIYLGTNCSMNCLHIAAQNGHLNLCKKLISFHHLDVNLADKDGWTALHHSARNDSYELVNFFRDMGTYIKCKDNSGLNCLHISAQNGHLKLCKKLIEKHNFDVDLPDYDGWTALHHSAKSGSYELVRYFVNMGSDIECKNNLGWNSLHIAARYGHFNLCKKLLNEYEFDVQLTDNNRWRPLHHSAKSGTYLLFEYIADIGNDIYCLNDVGWNCLHIAARNGHLNLCKKLIDKRNFKIDLPDYDGCTALHHSARNGSYELITYFADMGSDIKCKNNLGWNCLHIAAQNGHLKLCKKLINSWYFDLFLADKEGWTPLHHSARNGSYELVTYFTDMQTCIHRKDNSGLNCLHIAAQNGHLELCKNLLDKDSFDIDLLDYDGWTALHHSARSGSYKLVKYFVNMGSDIKCKNNLGWNSLHIAARYGHLNLCKKLLNKYKFNVQLTDNDGWRPLHHSARSGRYRLFEYIAHIGNDIYCKNSVGQNCLHIAAKNGHLKFCMKLIKKHNFDIDLADHDGWTALCHAARVDSLDLVRNFVDMGADIKLKDNSGMNCLHIAVNYGHLKLCKRLIDQHMFDVDVTDNKGRTALHHSARNGSYELARYFVDMGADVDFQDNLGMNCLHIAAKNGHLNLCKKLIDKYKIKIDLPDYDGWIALHHSARNGSYDLVRYFADMVADLNLEDNSGMNCLHIAAKNGHFSLCKTLIDKYKFSIHMTDNKGRTALHHFAINGSYDFVRYFVDMGADVKLKDNLGMNCLHIAAKNGNFSLCKTLIDECKFNVDVADNEGRTALHHSARNGSYDFFRYFVDMGADINSKDNLGLNFVLMAAQEGHVNLCKSLIEKHNVNFHVADSKGWTAIHYSAKSGSYELVKYFVDRGANIYLGTNCSMNCLHIAAQNGHLNLCKKLISFHHLDVNLADKDGWTALHHSARNDSYELVNFFRDMGTYIKCKDNSSLNCLHISAQNGHLKLCKKLIEKHNFDVDLPDYDGWTALHHSAKSGSYELVRYFVNMGSDIECKNNLGWNSLHIAARYGHFNLCKKLLNEYEFDVQLADNDGWRPLHHSARSGRYRLFEYIAHIGNDIYCKNSVGQNCLHIAAKNGHLKFCMKLIKKHNFDIDLADHDGWTALCHAASIGSHDLVRNFLDMGPDIKLKDNLGMNFLHIAVKYGHLKRYKRLIDQHKFVVNVADNEGRTALHYSVRNGSYEFARYFVDIGADVKLQDNLGMNCLHIAAKNDHLNLCKTLIDMYKFDDVDMVDNKGRTALHYAVRNGSYEFARYFVDIGADVKLQDNLGMNCLHIAAKNDHLNLCKTLIDMYKFDDVDMVDNKGRTALHFSARNGSNDVFTYFANTGADINIVDNLGLNCLHIAAQKGHFNFCKRLIDKYYFDFRVADNKGWTALHHSARSGNYELVKYFADMGTDIDLATNCGMNCLHIAASYGKLNLCKLLVDKFNFDVSMADSNGWKAHHHSARNGCVKLFAYFANMGLNIQCQTKSGWNCLIIAVFYGNLKLCRELLDKYNFKVNKPDYDGSTALHHSARIGTYELINIFTDSATDIDSKNKLSWKFFNSSILRIGTKYGDIKLCKELIAIYNFDVFASDKNGWTVVHHSAKNGSYELIKLFTDMGKDIYHKNYEGMNCLHIAARNGHSNLCKKLIGEYNFDANMADKKGWTVLHHFAKHGNYELVNYFADRGANIYCKNNLDENCLHIAAKNGHLDLCKTLIRRHIFDACMTDSFGLNPMLHSASTGRYELVLYFADMETDIYCKSNLGQNCLHIAAKNGHLDLCKILIWRHNFDVFMTDLTGLTPLLHSASTGSYELVTYFADMGNDILGQDKTGKNCLHIAARNGHINLCKKLLDEHKFDVEMCCNEGWTVLHYSAVFGSCEQVSYFVAMGTDIHLETSNGTNCLHIAAKNGNFSLCKTLIDEYKFNVDMADNEGWTALHHSARNGSYDFFRYFIDMGADINSKDNLGLNFVLMAAQEGHVNLCKSLIEKHSVNFRVADSKGWTAIHYSAKNGSYELIKLFTDMGNDIYHKNYEGMNCLHIAARNGHSNLCKKLIDEYNFDANMADKRGWTVLHHFAKHGNYELVNYFADRGANIYCKNNLDQNCLHIAAKNGNFSLCKTLIDEYKFNVDMADNEGRTALHHSARNGSYDFFRYFVDMKTDIYCKSNLGENCLHIAAKNGHLDLCKILIWRHNFDVSMTDLTGLTPLLHSASTGSYELVTYFADMGNDILGQDKTGKNCLHIAARNGHINLCKKLLDEHKFDVEMCCNEGWTVLHYSAVFGSCEQVSYFVAMGTDIHLKTSNGTNCLHIAAKNGNFSLCKTLIDEYKFNVDMTDNEGRTALHHSARNGSYDFFRYFVDMGGDINSKDNLGLNFVLMAAQEGHVNLCKSLIEKHNVNFHVADSKGWTAIHYSAKNGSNELIKLFTDMGNDTYHKNYEGMNCLHIAARNGHSNLCKKLIDEYNFDANMADKRGWTVLHHFAKHGNYELVNYFADRGANIYCKNNLDQNCLHIAAKNGHLDLCKTLIRRHIFDAYMTDSFGLNPMLHSASTGRYELVSYFADMGTDIYCKSNLGENCLHIAAKNGHLDLCKILIWRHNFDVFMTDLTGLTPLLHSASTGSYELVTYFADMGNDILGQDKTGKNCLHIAARNGHINLCKKLLDEHKFDVEMCCNEGWTVLHYSAVFGSWEQVSYFVAMGTDIHLKTSNGTNCLHIAAKNGNFSLCKTLIDEYKFNVDMADNEGRTALHHSARNGSYDFFRYFIDMGADINSKDNLGLNFVLMAAQEGHVNLCKSLIEKHSVNFRVADSKGWTAIHYSAKNGSYELIKLFTDMGNDIYHKNYEGMNCLHIAARNGHSNLCKKLIDEYNFDANMADKRGWTVLHHFAKHGNYELVNYFADRGANIYCKNNLDQNCLHIAAKNGNFSLCKTLIDEYKFNVDMADNEGRTALHHSARNGSYDFFRYFVDMKTDIYCKSNLGENCLHIAAKNGHLDLCKILIWRHNFDVSMTDLTGLTPLLHSASTGSYELVTYFADMGNDILGQDKTGKNCLHIAARNGHINLCKKLLDEHKFDVEMCCNEGWTVLHYSAVFGSWEQVSYFVAMGTDIHLKTSNGTNCLHIAAKNGNFSLCKTLIDEYKFNVDMTDNEGRTALHHSARNGSYDFFRYFIDMGGDINSKDNLGLNFVLMAAQEGHVNLCKSLIEKHNVNFHVADSKGWTAIHYSAKNGSNELIKLFTDMGNDTYHKNYEGMNCLHIAARNGHSNLCKKLIDEYNFDANMADKKGWTVLHHFAKHGNYELVNYFADRGANIYCKNNLDQNCLHIAAKNGHLDLCKTLIRRHIFDAYMTDSFGLNPMLHSASTGRYELVSYFADMGTDIYCKSNLGENCLHIAAKNGHLDLCKILIWRHNFDVFMTDLTGLTPLLHSASTGSYELVTYFADMGNDILGQDKTGKNCLHIAARNGHINLCKKLLDEHKFDVEMCCNEGWTVLHYSAVFGSCEQVSYFVAMGTDIHLKTSNGTNCLHIAAKHGHLNLCRFLIDKYGFDTYMENNEKLTALHFSAENGSFALFLYILKRGSDIYCKTNKMENVLHLSARNGHFDICEFVLGYFTQDYKDHNSRSQYSYNGKSYSSQIFYKYNTIFLHAMDIDGNTYLHLAAKGNQSRVCELLLKYDTEIITLANKKDETSRNIAQDNNYLNVLNALKAEYDREGMFFIYTK